MTTQLRSIRPAREKDIPLLVRFNADMALETENIVLDRNQLKKGVQAVFNNPDKGFYLVCEIDGDVRASLMVTFEWSDWRNGTFYWVQSVFVEKEFRRQGIYSSLYTYLQKEVEKKADIAGMRLYVEQDNTPAQKTYAKLGMKKTRYLLFEAELEKRSTSPKD